ncbi:MAG: hypothetical protein RR977_02135 [Oscillospiraceae bacterium]
MSEEQKRKRFPVNKKMLFGGVVLIFAVIGLIATVIFSVHTIGNATSGSKTKKEMEWLISPVVMQDPPPFESPEKMTNTTIITAGVWKLIMNEDTSKYPIDEFNFITVPQSDIEVQIKSLFGDVKYTHETVGDTELMITYNQEEKSYVFPAMPHVLPYTPKVQDVKKADDKYVLTVGYIPPGLVWEGDINGKKYEPAPEKIMQYTLTITDKKQYQIYAVADIFTGQDLNSDSSSNSSSESSKSTSKPETSTASTSSET